MAERQAKRPRARAYRLAAAAAASVLVPALFVLASLGIPALATARPSATGLAMVVGMVVLGRAMAGGLALKAYLDGGQVRMAALAIGLLAGAGVIAWQGFLVDAPANSNLLGALARGLLGAMLLSATSAAVTLAADARRRLAVSVILGALAATALAFTYGRSLSDHPLVLSLGGAHAVSSAINAAAAALLVYAAARALHAGIREGDRVTGALGVAAALGAGQSIGQILAEPWTAGWWATQAAAVTAVVVVGCAVHASASQAAREERVITEARLRSERLSSLGTLVAGVAHEINNPLTFIRSNIQLAVADLKDAEAALGHRERAGSAGGASGASSASGATAAAAATAITVPDLRETVRGLEASLEGAERIARITKSLKAVARKGASEREDIDLRDVPRSVADLVRIGLPARIEVRVQCPPERVPMRANAGELHQVVLNLAKNAIEAIGDRGGAVTLTVQNRDKAVELRVSDDGPGMPPSVRDQLFTPFFTTKAQGTGLGLSIVHTIVEDHGGKILVESEPGKGTTFVIRFPVETHSPVEARLEELF